MEVLCVTIPSETFSRFDYFNSKSLELQTRFNTLQFQNTKTLKSPKFVRLHLCKNSRETEFPVETCDFLEIAAKDKCQIGNIGKYKSLKCYLKSQNDFESTLSLLIVGSEDKKEINELGENPFYTIIIENDDVTKIELTEELKKEGEPNIKIATKETISSEVSGILERISLSPLKKISEDCYRLLQNDRKKSSSKKLISSTLSYTQKPDKKFRRVEKKNGPLSAHASTSDQNRFVEPIKNGKTRGKETQRSKRGTTKLNENHSQNSTGHEINSEKIYTRSTQRSKRGTTKLNENHSQNSTGHEFNSKKIYTRSKRRSEYQPMTGSLEDKRRKVDFSDQNGLSNMASRSMDVANNREDSYEYLLEAILSLYRMSNVPETEKPDVPKQSFKVTEELRNALFDRCPSIRRMGYRYRTFTIYAVQPESSFDKDVRNNRITSILKEHDIHNFAIFPCEEDITPLMHVGAKIQARSDTAISLRSRTISKPDIVKGGTLGCFVLANDGGQHCLLSKHVAEGCSDVYYVAHSNNTRLGHILPETIRDTPGLDISAALMEEHIDDAGRKFKNMKEKYVHGQLYNYKKNEEDAIFGSGHPVYIRGASTNPGKGEVTMPFVESGMSTTLIQVEDRIRADGTVAKHFADKGDSGSIVCADVPGDDVHAVSMVVGTNNREDSITTRRRKYLTIPLSKGLQQLENETGKKFEL